MCRAKKHATPVAASASHAVASAASASALASAASASQALASAASASQALASAASDEATAAALVAMAQKVEDNQDGMCMATFCEVLRARGAVEQICRLSEHPAPLIHQTSLMLLASLTTTDVDPRADASCKIIRDATTIPTIMLRLGSQAALTVACACAAIQNICSEAETVTVVSELGGIERLQELSRCDQPAIVASAHVALRNIEAHRKAEAEMAAEEEGSSTEHLVVAAQEAKQLAVAEKALVGCDKAVEAAQAAAEEAVQAEREARVHRQTASRLRESAQQAAAAAVKERDWSKLVGKQTSGEGGAPEPTVVRMAHAAREAAESAGTFAPIGSPSPPPSASLAAHPRPSPPFHSSLFTVPSQTTVASPSSMNLHPRPHPCPRPRPCPRSSSSSSPTPLTPCPHPSLSSLTPHPSPPTPHPSPLTPHPAPRTPHPSPIAHHPSPITHYPSPITHHPT